MLSEIKENVQGTNTNGKETGTQIKGEWVGWSGVKGGNGTTNSIINKYILKNKYSCFISLMNSPPTKFFLTPHITSSWFLPRFIYFYVFT